MARLRLLIVALLLWGALAEAAGASPSAIVAPVPKWSRGGCYAMWCQTGWYGSPAVADLNKDGQPDVIWGSYDVVVLNGSTGALEWRGDSPTNRVYSSVAVADLTGDGTLEVIVGRDGNEVTVYSNTGAVLWTRHPFSGGEVRNLAVADLENDGLKEIIAGSADNVETKQVTVLEPDGTVRPGFPARRDGDPGMGWGIFNQSLAVGDLNADGFKEIYAPTDTHFITALDRFGNQLATHAMFDNAFEPFRPKAWSEVGVHVDLIADLRGHAHCGTDHRPNFANVASVIADLNGDGALELIVPGDVYNCAPGFGDNIVGDLYIMPFILKYDRTRWSASGFDWTVIPTPGPNTLPLIEDFNVMKRAMHNAVVADLDNNGFKEILFPAYDGKLHAYWLDKTEHGQWPFNVYPGNGDFVFASEPAVVDLDNDGQAEVLFTTWTKIGSNRGGRFIIASASGQLLQEAPLPRDTYYSWDGGMGAPTVANLDADADLEVVIGTAHTGVVAYDLPNTANARILWGTGRGSYLRAGTLPECIRAFPSGGPGVTPAGPYRLYLPLVGKNFC